jgi:TonB family protein
VIKQVKKESKKEIDKKDKINIEDKKVEKEKIEQKEEIKPELIDKKEEIKSDKLELPKVELEKPRNIEMQDLDIKVERNKKIDIKDIDEMPTLKEKNRDFVNKDDVKALINLEAVGDRKVSQKTLDLANELEKKVKVRNFDNAPKMELKDNENKIKNLDRKIVNMVDAPVINMSNKTFDTKKDIDIDVKAKRVSASSFDSKDITVLEDKVSSGQKNNRQKNIDYVDTRPVKIVSKNVMELNQEMPKKEESKIIKAPIRENKQVNREIKEDLGRNSDNNIRNVKRFEITGKIKDRKIIYSKMPEYPDWAQQQGIEARIYVYLEVAPDGKVIDDSIRIEITSGYKKLDDYVKEVLKFWKFENLNSQEIQSGIINFNFKLS